MTNICMPLLNAESSMKIYKCAPRGWPITTSTGDGGMGYIYWYDATYHYGTYGGDSIAFVGDSLLYPPFGGISNVIDYDHFIANRGNGYLDVFKYIYNNKLYPVYDEASGYARFPIQTKTWQEIFNDPDLTA